MARKRRDVAAPPDDALGIQQWAYRLVAQQMHGVANDRSLSSTQRRESILRHANTLVPLMPRAALHNAQDAVLGEQRELDSTRKGPELEDAAEVNRTSGGATARRGRPRKRASL